MKILAVSPGADVATADVYTGLAGALRAQGHDVYEYALSGRIVWAGAFLDFLHRRQKRTGGPLAAQKPTAADVTYLASHSLLERALIIQPDWVLIISGMYVASQALTLLRRAGLRVALVLTESPYDAPDEFRLAARADVVWTCERTCVESYRYANPRTQYLQHAHDPAVHRPEPEGAAPVVDVAAHDVVFVGTGFQERIELLAGVDWAGLGIDLGLYGAWSLLAPRHPLRRFVQGGLVTNAAAVALYRRAKIGLNLYRQSRGFGKHAPRIHLAESLNPRAVELAGCGVFTLSDHRAEVAETFGPLVPTFPTGDASELEVLIRRWLPDEDGRRRVAAQLPACVADHTYAARARQITEELSRGAFSLLRAPAQPIVAALA